MSHKVIIFSNFHLGRHPGPKKKAKQADAAKASFYTNDGDLLTMLSVYKQWLTWDKSPEWCREKFIHCRLLKEVYKIREQLSDTMTARDMTILSCGANTQPVLKSICAGLIKNVACKSYGRKHTYVTLPKNDSVFIHPGSSVFRTEPAWVVYQKVVQTQKPYMRGVTPISAEWLKEYAPAFHHV